MEEIIASDVQNEQNVQCGHGAKARSEKELKDLANRLSRVEGQIRGIKGMLEKDACCADILRQTAAVNAALNSFNRVLLAEHIRTCVVQDVINGREDAMDELLDTLKSVMRQ